MTLVHVIALATAEKSYSGKQVFCKFLIILQQTIKKTNNSLKTNLTDGSFRVKHPEIQKCSSLTPPKFAQNLSKCCISLLTRKLKNLAQYLVYFMKYDLWKFGTPFQ